MQDKFWEPLGARNSLNLSADASQHAAATCSAAKCLRVVGGYGRTNNVLIRFVNELLLATQMRPKLALVGSHSDNDAWKSLHPHFATGLASVLSFSCRKDESACTEWETIEAESTFQMLRTLTAEGRWFHGRVLRHLLLHVDESTQKQVDAFDKSHHLTCGVGGFAVLHLRGMEHGCERRVKEGNVLFGYAGSSYGRPGMWSADGVRFFTGADVCTCSRAFIKHFNPHGLPIFLMHDGQQPERARAIIKEHGAITMPKAAGNQVFAEMAMALRASASILNPASSLSRNLAVALGHLQGV